MSARIGMKIPNESNEAFVTAAYRLLLGRAPDEDGMIAMLAAIRGDTARITCISEMVNSVEFRKRLDQLRTASPRP